MKKGVIFGTLAGIMLLSLTGCGNSGNRRNVGHDNLNVGGA